jgi:RNA polymerase sigma-70 factor (ECF subfamily)
MLRVAAGYVGRRSIAEEVVQDTWIAVMGGLGRFELRSSLRTWIFDILINRARTAAQRERRHSERATDSLAAFSSPPPADPEHVLLDVELRDALSAAIAELPQAQRAVVTLREIEGWTSAEVREVLRVSAGNQRVILYRARARLRRALQSWQGPLADRVTASEPAPALHEPPPVGRPPYTPSSSSIIPCTTSNPPCQNARSVTSMPVSARISSGRAEPP